MELATAQALPLIDLARCTACGDCITVCHASALGLVDELPAVTKPDACDYCTDCEAVCPPGAIRCPFEMVLA